MYRFLFAVLLVIATAQIGCTKNNVQEFGDHVTLMGIKFRGHGAYKMSFGGVARKNQFLFFRPNLAVQRVIRPAPGPILTTAIQVHQRTAKSVNLTAKVPGVSVGGQLTTENVTVADGTYIIVWLAEDSQLIDAINADPIALETAKELGGKARIISSVVLARDAATEVKAKLAPAAQVTVQSVEGGLEFTSETDQKVRVPDEMVCAFAISRPCWGKDASGKVIVKQVIDDNPGLGFGAPVGTEFDPKKLK